MSGTDEQISQLFEEERKIDEGLAPSFDRVLESQRRRLTPSRRRLVPVAGLLALVLAVTASLLLRQPTPGGPTDPSLFYWQSPTEACLGVPGDEMLGYLTGDSDGHSPRGQQ